MTTNTALALMTYAYKDAQKLPSGGTLSATQQSEGLDRLNDIINYLSTKGLKLWLETETPVTLTATKQMYSIYPGGDIPIARPMRVKEAAYWDAYNNVRSLTVLSREEWTRLSNRTTQGSVNQYFVEKLYDRLNLYLYNTPDTTAATGSVKIVLANFATTPASVGLATNFPPEWFICLRWTLADDLTTGSPPEVVQRCQTKAAQYQEALESQDVEEAPTFFQPDTQLLQPSRFR